MGVPVSGKNLFPSNIAGLPTWYTIRASKDGYVARKRDSEVLVALNPETAREDMLALPAGRRRHLRGEPEPEAVSQRRGLLSGSVRQDHCRGLPRGQAAQAGEEHGLRGRGGADAPHRSRRRRKGRQEAVCQKAEGLRPELWRCEGGLRLRAVHLYQAGPVLHSSP